ncbi:mRNA-capping enzyme [Daktulosphaira vitifoliae]|uniref:mRNA-capping enzyme n=1 Tax=Daktulosphaira vitifoliae TaxID=58002 RepID=UPI0021AA493C|nr:mRNA-capping enzyme [Daktulosphaira vitifoliae]
MSGSKRYRSGSSYSSYVPPVPDRWLKCPRKSFTPITDKFVAFKTPLDSKYDGQVPITQRFNTEMLFSSLSNMKISLGLWIDLTKTSRFYDKSEVENMNCAYVKLPCAGHEQPPTREQAQLFIDICSKFVAKNPLQSIGVHCTHGFNRTGFMIATYLIEVLDFDVNSALAQFAAARPPGIYKQDYIVELFQRYSDEEPILAPELPDWCLETEENTYQSKNESTSRYKRVHKDDHNSKDKQDHENPNKRSRRELNNKNPVFMEGVSGVTAVLDQPKLSNIQRKVQQLCHWNKSGFPGSQPVSMDIQNMKLLHTKPYRVTWKADGTRYMMFIQEENEVYFIDRDNSVFEVDELKFFHRKNLDHHLKDTLLDGEMIIDKVDDQNFPRYLVYDVIAFEGFDIGEQPFYPNRLMLIEVDIIKPRHQAIMCGKLDKTRETFSVRLKQFYDITASDKLLGNFSKNLSHEPDGLIFQPSTDPYVAGTCPEVLKWKPLELNSVDFRLKIVTEGGTGMLDSKTGYLYVGGKNDPFARIKYTKEIKNMDGKIIECKFENGCWKFMRERTDKSFPNALKTALAICHSIEQPVTKEILLKYIQNVPRF